MAKKVTTKKSRAVTTAQLEQVRKMLKEKRVGREAFQFGLDRGIVAKALDQIKIDSAPATLLHIDRSVKPVYPDWVEAVIHPELENTGPTDYSIAEVEQWLHDGQKAGGVSTGQVIYEYLVGTNQLQACLGLRDFEEIQKKGLAFFRTHFQNKAVFAWKSVVRDRNGSLFVPCLCGDDGRVVLGWGWLGLDWDDNSPALRLAKSAKA